MEIRRAGNQPSGTGPSEWFTGTVWRDPLFNAPPSALAPEKISGPRYAPAQQAMVDR